MSDNRVIIDLVNDKTDDNDGISIDDAFDLTIDPRTVKLVKLLELAYVHRRNAISIRGVESTENSGEMTWGVITVAGPDSARIMDALEKVLNEVTDSWPDESPTREDIPIN